MNKIISVVIVDDEPLARKRLLRQLENHKEYIQVIAEAGNGEEGKSLIEQLKPALIFLDIEMPVMNGFEMLKSLNHVPAVIFTTAFDAYAIKAFEENSIDYLLKPVEQQRLDKALEKFFRFNKQPDNSLRFDLEKLVSTIHPKKEMKALPVKVGDKTLLIKPEQISYFEAKDKYVSVFTTNNNEYITDLTLSTLEEKLPPDFLRIHRAYIINTEKVKEMHRGFNSTHIFVMNDSQLSKISSGRSYNELIKEFFDL